MQDWTRELWKVTQQGQGLPCMMDAPMLICTPVLLITQLEYCIVIPPAQGRGIESMLRLTKPPCLSPTSYEHYFSAAFTWSTNLLHWLVGDGDRMEDVARPKRKALILVMASCWLSVTWPPVWDLESRCRSVALKVDKWNVYRNCMFTIDEFPNSSMFMTQWIISSQQKCYIF